MTLTPMRKTLSILTGIVDPRPLPVACLIMHLMHEWQRHVAGNQRMKRAVSGQFGA
ncbi:hypothetical protein [Noviherbaspirillum sp.]|uniref:hypothetical protein n=1 Tax=Noviherbaspirillum sp. TaxID=1926288 RepID=UPI002FE074EA